MKDNFKNIDQLFKDTLSSSTLKAPKSIKAKVISKSGNTKFIIIGFLFLTIGASAIIGLSNKSITLNQYSSRNDSNGLILENEKEEFFFDRNELIENNTILKTTNSKTELKKESVLSNIIYKEPITNKNIKSKNNKIQPPTLEILTPIDEEIFENKSEIKNTKKLDEEIIDKETHKLPLVNDPNQEFNEKQYKDLDENEIPKLSIIDSSITKSPIVIIDNDDTISEPITYNIIDSSKTEDIDPIIVSPSPTKGYWMAGLTFGPTINRANYKKTSNSELGNYLTKNNIEKTGFNSQLNLDYTFNNKFNTGIGIGLDNQKFNTTYWTSHEESNIDTNSTFSHYILDSNNIILDTVYTITYDTSSTTSIINNNGTSKLNYLHIPIHIGYQSIQGRWIFGAQAGIQMNILYKQKGEYYLNNQIKDLANEAIFNKFNYQFNLGVNTGYNIAQNFYLYGHINYSFYSNNYLNKSYASRQINSIQLGIGGRLKF